MSKMLLTRSRTHWDRLMDNNSPRAQARYVQKWYYITCMDACEEKSCLLMRRENKISRYIMLDVKVGYEVYR